MIMGRETKVELGIVLTRASTGYWVKLYTLDDGREITANELAERLECSVITARARLQSSTDPKHIFRSVRDLVHGDKNLMNPNTWYKDPMIRLVLSKSSHANS